MKRWSRTAILSLLLAASVGSLGLPSTPDAQAATNGCHKIGVVGDSKSDWNGARLHIEMELRQRGLPFVVNASDGRSVFGPGRGTDARSGSGEQVVSRLSASGFDCIIVALGGNDAAQYLGNRGAAAHSINAIMRAARGAKVDWVTSSTNVHRGSYADSYSAVYRSELDRATHRWRNLDINHWERVPQSLPFWWNLDGIHLATGNLVRGGYTVDSAFINGSR